MIKTILKIAIDKAVKENDPFIQTPCFELILNYIGVAKAPTVGSMNIYQYAKDRNRDYNACRKLVSKYQLGTMVNGKRLLNINEQMFLDELRRW